MAKDKVKETEPGKEPSNAIGLLGQAKQKIESLFGHDNPRVEGSDEYHNRRTQEELENAGALEKPKTGDSSEHAEIMHPALKVLMAKLNLHKDEDEPAGKGGFSGMKV